ncbi:MAG: hypothetical protein IID34_12475 [Planctomycetes bacterium]|nr:hypothetical protein [Planctomycetota bacterium]
MSQLPYLLDEICSTLAMYYSGRSTGQSLKTAFILCDDYAELLSKLFLIEDDTPWSETKKNNHYKNFHDVLKDLESVFAAKRSGDLAKLKELTTNLRDRRKRRNEFFHSTHLLDLNINTRGCVEALCSLIDYGALLFGTIWHTGVRSRPRMNTFCTLLELERGSFDDPTLWCRVDEILKVWPRRGQEKKTISKKGTQYAEHPEDLHLRMCVDWGGRELLVKLHALLPSES